MGLVGIKSRISIIKIGTERSTIESKLYKVPLCDDNGNVEFFEECAIEKISTAIESNDVSEIATMLDGEPENVKRPEGEIELLIRFE